jgi:hypothetical protein
MPSAAHYVGYVEDDETPEMIMKKFEAMDSILAAEAVAARHAGSAAQPTGDDDDDEGAGRGGGDGGGDGGGAGAAAVATAATQAASSPPPGEQPGTAAPPAAAPPNDNQARVLEAIFKATSVFNVRSVLAGNEGLVVSLTATAAAGASGRGGGAAGRQQQQQRERRRQRSAAARAATLACEVGADDRAYSDGASSDFFLSDDENYDYDHDDDHLDLLRSFWSDGEDLGAAWGDSAAARRRRQRAGELAQRRAERRAGREAVKAAKDAERAARKAEREAARKAEKAEREAAAAAAAASAPAAAAGRGRGRGGRGGGGRTSSSSSALATAATRARMLAAAHDAANQALLRRRAKLAAAAAASSDALEVVRVPALPLPVGWGRVVTPLSRLPLRPVLAVDAMTATAATASAAPPPSPPLYAEAPDLTALDFEQAFPTRQGRDEYLAILINSGWEQEDEDEEEEEEGQEDHQHPQAAAAAFFRAASRRRAKAARRLRALPLAQLCPRGFVFVWAGKENISAVVDALCDQQYVYVESLAWVLLSPGNAVLRLGGGVPSLAARSHRTLLVFRRADGAAPGTRDIELRHQRSPDVVLDCVVAAAGGDTLMRREQQRDEQQQPQQRWRVPRGVYEAIETMLPTSVGARLELWAEVQVEQTRRRRDLRAPPPAIGRHGWAHVAEVKPST